MIPKKHEPIRIGFYICHCGTNIAGMVDVEAVAKYVSALPNVAVSRTYKYMCSDPGQELVREDIQEHRLNRVVVAACSPLLHEHTFRQAVEKGGINPFYFQMVNIREHNAWVHTDRAEATRKAIALARAGVQRVAFHKPLEVKRVPINPSVLILGGGSPASTPPWFSQTPASMSIWSSASQRSAATWPSSTRPSPPWTAPRVC